MDVTRASAFRFPKAPFTLSNRHVLSAEEKPVRKTAGPAETDDTGVAGFGLRILHSPGKGHEAPAEGES